ncbi:MAG TPA: hypothetical protein VMS79_01580 [Methanomassiliicoccales archaeon]|jgi:hypothetical protein|nr:hypothetical protein [Methanomassiliicoccales archaeon]
MRKKREIIAIVLLLIAVIAVGWLSQSGRSDYHGGTVGMSAGRGQDTGVQAFPKWQGNYVVYIVDSQNGEPLNVYLTTENGAIAAYVNETFPYAASGSAFGITHIQLAIDLSTNPEYHDLVIQSANPASRIPFTVAFEQAPYPVDFNVILGVVTFVCSIASTFLFFLLIYAFIDLNDETKIGAGKRTPK